MCNYRVSYNFWPFEYGSTLSHLEQVIFFKKKLLHRVVHVFFKSTILDKRF